MGGHYWHLPPAPARLPHLVPLDGLGEEFEGIAPPAWHGLRSNLFCIDYAVGARYRKRAVGHDGHGSSRFALGALRWPEREMALDSGQRRATLQPWGHELPSQWGRRGRLAWGMSGLPKQRGPRRGANSLGTLRIRHCLPSCPKVPVRRALAPNAAEPHILLRIFPGILG